MSLAEKELCVELDVASDLLPDAADVTNIIHKGTFGTETVNCT